MATLKTTAEGIVREHREEMERYWNETSPGELHGLETRPTIIDDWKTIFCAIPWGRVWEWSCCIVVAACLVYLGIFVFAPFTLRMMR